MSVKKIKDRVYAETTLMGANVASIDTDQGLVLIDTPYLPHEIKQWKEALASLSNKAIVYLINTHHHFDHCLGNTFYTPNVIAHQVTYDEMIKPDGTMRHYFVSQNRDLPEATKKQIYGLPIGLPRMTFTQRLCLHLGDATMQLFHIGGHTDSSILIYLIEDKILFSGDAVVCNMHPYKGQANFHQWIAGLEKIVQMDIDIIVPGHGEVCDKSEAERALKYFRLMWDRVLTLRRQGCNRYEVVKRAHDLISFYPVEPGIEVEAAKRFDESIARLFDEVDTQSV